MLYEMRSYDLKPSSMPEILKPFGEAYEKRWQHSQLGFRGAANRLQAALRGVHPERHEALGQACERHRRAR